MKNKKIISLLTSTFAVCLTAAAISAAPVTASAATSAPTVNEITGKEFNANDYSFAGYSIDWQNASYEDSTSGATKLRFKMQLSQDLYTYVTTTDNVTTGTLIYPAYYLDGDVSALTVDSKVGEAEPIDIETTGYWDETDRTSVVYLNEIPRKYFSSAIAVRGYICVNGTYYYSDAEGEVARSVAYVAMEDYADNVSYKEEMKNALAQFKYQLDDGTVESKCYGDKVTAPADAFDSISLYTNATGTAIWDCENNVITGDTKLLTKTVDTKNYYAKSGTTVEIPVDDSVATVTTATVGTQTVSASYADGKLTLSGTGLQSLESGEKYLVTFTDSASKTHYAGLTCVEGIKDGLYYEGEALSDAVALTPTTATTLTGEEITVTNGALVGVKNETKVMEEESYLVTTAEGTYLVNLDVYGYVIRDNVDAYHFFFGTPVEQTGGYYDVSAKEGRLCANMADKIVAMANDVTLKKGTEAGEYSNRAKPSTSLTLDGTDYVFDGLGHTITCTSSEENFLFGSEVGRLDTIKNVQIKTSSSGAFLGRQQTLSLSLENVCISFEQLNNGTNAALFISSSLSLLQMKDVFIYNSRNNGIGSAKSNAYENLINTSGATTYGFAQDTENGETATAALDRLGTVIDGHCENVYYYANCAKASNLVGLPVFATATIGSEVCVYVGKNQPASAAAITEAGYTYTANNKTPTKYVQLNNVSVWSSYVQGKDSGVTSVGNWKINYGTKITEVTVTWNPAL